MFRGWGIIFGEVGGSDVRGGLVVVVNEVGSWDLGCYG